MTGLGGLLHPGEVGVDDLAVALQREDQRDVDADPLGQALGYRGQPGRGGGDLDEQVRPVHQPPQGTGLGDGLLGVARQPRVHLQRDPAVYTVRGVVGGPEHVAGPPDVVGGDGPGRLPHGHAAQRQLGKLLVVGVPVAEGMIEDRRVGGDPDHVPVTGERSQVAAGQPGSVYVVEPDGHAGGGQFSECVGMCGHDCCSLLAGYQPTRDVLADRYPFLSARLGCSLSGGACLPHLYPFPPWPG